MKKPTYLFLILALLISSTCFSQQWNYSKEGNAFDGFYRVAGIDLLDNSSFLAVINKSETLTLEWGEGGEKTMDKLLIVIKFKNIDNPNSLLMSFDDETKVYELNFNFDPELSFAFLKEAYGESYSELYNKFSIIDLFKSKKEVHFRISNDDKKIDHSFNLIGFTSTINKVANYRNSTTDDEGFEVLYRLSFMLKIPKEIFNIYISENCIEYLGDKYGEYFYHLIDSIELKTNESHKPEGLSFEEYINGYYPELVLINKYGQTIALIKSEVFFNNVFYLSGNYKKYDDDKKLLKDEGSLKAIYNLLLDERSLIGGITFEKFSQASKEQIIEYYQIFKDHNDEDKIFGKECTLDVFSESWGFKS